MTGSVAEERIRTKAEDALRLVWPSARIVHELMLSQGGRRIDLAAITPDRLIVVEIKSERDVLDRLKAQREAAVKVADCFVAVVASCHWRKAWEAGHVPITEAAEEDKILTRLERSVRETLVSTCNAPARLQMLWASELRRVAGTNYRTARDASIRTAADNLTGREVRTRVCDALRAREFARADPPILSELFPEPSKGVL